MAGARFFVEKVAPGKFLLYHIFSDPTSLGLLGAHYYLINHTATSTYTPLIALVVYIVRNSHYYPDMKYMKEIGLVRSIINNFLPHVVISFRLFTEHVNPLTQGGRGGGNS